MTLTFPIMDVFVFDDLLTRKVYVTGKVIETFLSSFLYGKKLYFFQIPQLRLLT